jgi:hypothetical protein
MVFPTQSLLRRLAGGVSILTLVLLLVACAGGNNSPKSGGSSNGTGSNPVKQIVTATAYATATHMAAGMATATKNGLKTYTGTGFTVEYPEDWKLTTSSTETAFTDPTGSYNLSIGSTPNPQGEKTAAQLTEGGIAGAKNNLKNVRTVNVPQTTTVAGQIWNQSSITGTSTLNGQSSDVQAVVLANNHLAHSADTKGYVIVYVAAKDKFDQAQTKYFQPMLQSFKYTT